MIYFAKPGLREDFYIVKKEELLITCYMCDTYTWQMRNLLVRDKPILSSERMLYKDYDLKGSVVKKCGRGCQRAWYQEEIIGGKPPAVK
jgi:hypothetical protein